jgi:hypothetical protein
MFNAKAQQTDPEGYRFVALREAQSFYKIFLCASARRPEVAASLR